MKCLATKLCIVLIMMSNLSVCQVPSSGYDKQKLISEIRIGNESAMLEAANTGDRSFIPYLRKQLQSKDRGGIAETAKIALAKMGETEQMQQLVCEAFSHDRHVQYHTIKFVLPRVNGWFAIHLLEYLLEADQRFYENAAHRPEGDVLYSPPSELAVVVLPKLVSNPPAQSPRILIPGIPDTSKEKLIWREWIASNKQTLSKLEPTGEGVNFSQDACRKPPSGTFSDK